MKDTSMIKFYNTTASLADVAAAWAAWQSWCQDNDEPAGTMPEFVGRLRRCHEAQRRQRVARGRGCRVGAGRGRG